MNHKQDVAFVPHILPLVGADPDKRPSAKIPGPMPVLLHYAPKQTKRIMIYVPGLIEGLPLTGRHDYRVLGRALDAIDCSLMLTQMSSAQWTPARRFETCADDIRTAVEFAKSEGFTEIALAGLSMGGPRVAYWNATYPDPAVKTIIFIATIESSYLASARNWTAEQKARHDATLDACRAAIAEGEPDRIIPGELLGLPMPLSADVYISFLGQLDEMNASTIKFADKVIVPAAVIHSTEDVIAPPESAQAIHDSLVNAPRRGLRWIEGGDHQLLTPNRVGEKTSAVIAEWIDGALGR